jgi:hypothetical protein
MTEILYIPKLNEIVLFDGGNFSFDIYTRTLTIKLQCKSIDTLKLVNTMNVSTKDMVHIGWL